MTSDDTGRWAFTFGFDHKHPVTGESLANRYVIVSGRDYDDARNKMVSAFDTAWAFQYGMHDIPRLIERYNLVELPWSDTVQDDALVRRVDDLTTLIAEKFFRFAHMMRLVDTPDITDRAREGYTNHARQLAREIENVVVDWVREGRD